MVKIKASLIDHLNEKNLFKNIHFFHKKDEKKQIIVSSGWLDMTWTDYNLQWNPEEFGNITSLRVSSRKIWIPGSPNFRLIILLIFIYITG